MPGPSIEPVLACALDMESGYGRCEDATGAVGTVGVEECAYDEGVIVLVLGVELVGVKLELALERTDGDGEPTIAESIISMMVSGETCLINLFRLEGHHEGQHQPTVCGPIDEC